MKPVDSYMGVLSASSFAWKLIVCIFLLGSSKRKGLYKNNSKAFGNINVYSFLGK